MLVYNSRWTLGPPSLYIILRSVYLGKKEHHASRSGGASKSPSFRCKKMKPAIIVALILAVMLAGCLSSEKPQQDVQKAPPSDSRQRPYGQGDQRGDFNRTGFRGGFNMTPEEIAQRMQAAIQSCDGKNVNETCEIQNPRGTINGTCHLQNQTLMCGFNRYA